MRLERVVLHSRRFCLTSLAILTLSTSPMRAHAACKLAKMAELPVTMSNSRPVITAKINGRDARFVVDSGSFFSWSARSDVAPPAGLPDAKTLKTFAYDTKAAATMRKVNLEHFDKTFSINVKGLLFTVQKALPLLKDGGSIVLNASIAGIKGMEAFGVYAATKAAVRSFARSWTTKYTVARATRSPRYRSSPFTRSCTRRSRSEWPP